MPQTVAEQAGFGSFLIGYRDLTCPTTPDIGNLEWAGNPFWSQRGTFEVDQARTDALAKFNVPIEANSGTFWDGWWAGTPYQINTGLPLTEFGPIDEPFWTNPFTYAKRYAARVVKVPTPALVRRETDPAGGGDMHTAFYDPTSRQLWEQISVVHQPNGKWESTGVHQWDLKIPWEQQSTVAKPKGAIAVKIPMLPLIPRWEEFAAGRITHMLHYVSNNYNPAFTGPVRASDGTNSAHPLRGGERLRLKPGVKEKIYKPGSWEWIVCVALEEFGMLVTDSNSFKSDNSGRGGLRMSQDRRLENLRLNLRLTDFVVEKWG